MLIGVTGTDQVCKWGLVVGGNFLWCLVIVTKYPSYVFMEFGVTKAREGNFYGGVDPSVLISLCIWIRLSIYLCICTCVWACMCVCVFMCACRYVCICAHFVYLYLYIACMLFFHRVVMKRKSSTDRYLLRLSFYWICSWL